MASTAPSRHRRTAASTPSPVRRPARASAPPARPYSQAPTPTWRAAGSGAMTSSGPTRTMSASAASSAAAATSGPMPRGSPTVTARRGLVADFDVDLAAEGGDHLAHRPLLAHVRLEAFAHLGVLEPVRP